MLPNGFRRIALAQGLLPTDPFSVYTGSRNGAVDGFVAPAKTDLPPLIATQPIIEDRKQA
jgi:hypothetical protein